MKNTIEIIKKNHLLIIILLGLILRIVFIVFIAEPYFNRESIFFDTDTLAWQKCIENLINSGTYTTGVNGEFSRMPGYPFFMGFIYLIFGKDWTVSLFIIGWIQIILDVFCIYLVYHISKNFYDKTRISIISACFYATYPFIIVWNPVAYAEQFSIFLMICSLYFFSKHYKKNKLIYLIICGLFLAISSLTRPQIIPLVLILALTLILKKTSQIKLNIKKGFLLCCSFIVIFGIWPARNFINHGEFIITKNADGFLSWQEDVISFMQFTYSVKSEWEPQFSSIINNKETSFPEIAYGNSLEDSIKLERAIYLAKNCGSGFSFKTGYWKNKIYPDQKNCNEEISKLFYELRENQMRNNKFNFYVKVPLKNLYKAIFKFRFSENSSKFKKLATILFFWRTFLLIIGIVGALYSFKSDELSQISILFMISIYFVLCFGTAPFMRNIEIRYFLPADVLLLFPAAKSLINFNFQSLFKIKFL